MKPSLSHEAIVKGSVIQACTNTVINGTITYFLIRGKDTHLITADSITSGSDTVVGHAVTTAMILAVIFTVLGFNSHKRLLPRVAWWEVAGIAIWNALSAFGLLIIAGVLWQRVMPDISVGTVAAAGIGGAIAGTVSGLTNFSTLKRLGERER